jgi:uncharacterized protein YcaQ
VLEISLSEARALAVATQGLHTDVAEQSGMDVLEQVSCIQLDTISVVRRSHELVQLARGVPSGQAENLIVPGPAPQLFEYWGRGPAPT